MAGAYVLFGVGNRVIHKMALVPMKDYLFFLAQLLCLAYVCVYTPILYARYRSGKVTKDMLKIPKKNFVLIGLCESLAYILLLICTSKLPGVILPILGQLMLIWQLVISKFLLNRRYSISQVTGVLFVVCGSILAATATAASPAGGKASVPYMLLINVVFMLYSISFVTKEKIFEESEKLLGKRLDVFVVNSFGSITQAVGVILLFPLLMKLNGIDLSQAPQYLKESACCLCGVTLSNSSNCSGAPLLCSAYIAANIAVNVVGLYLIRSIGVVAASLSAALIVPTTVAVFSLPLPYLGKPTKLSLQFMIGCAVLISGMLIYVSKELTEGLTRGSPSG